MSISSEKQPDEEKSFDIDVSRETRRSDEVVSSIISMTSDPVGLTFASESIISAKLLRVIIGGGTDGVTYKITTKFVTNYSPILEKENYIAVYET